MGVLGCIPLSAPCLYQKDTKWEALPRCFRMLGWKMHCTASSSTDTRNRELWDLFTSTDLVPKHQKVQNLKEHFSENPIIFHPDAYFSIFNLRMSMLVSVELLFWYKYKQIQTLSTLLITPFWLGSLCIWICDTADFFPILEKRQGIALAV